MARIILLNGAGSAGKSSIAKALQEIAAEPFLHVAMDGFLDMLPEAYMDHCDGLLFEKVEEHGKPAIVIKSGPVAGRLLRGMRRAVAALAHEGNNLIVDDVMLEMNGRIMPPASPVSRSSSSACSRLWRCLRHASVSAATA